LSQREVTNCIPTLYDIEVNQIKSELKGIKSISVSFDGTTEVAEIINIVIRFVKSNGVIAQRLIALKVLLKSPNAKELSAFIIEVLFTRYGFAPSQIHCITRDGAPVNTCACDKLQDILYNCVFPICICHSVAIAGFELNASVNIARVFISCWSMMISHSGSARMKFQEYAGVKAMRMGQVRWFTFWEVGAQLHEFYKAAKLVINDPTDFAEESRQSLRLYANNPIQEKILLLELALIKDCEFLVQFCYKQEGDGFLCVTTFGHFEHILDKLNTITDKDNPIAPHVEVTALRVGVDADEAVELIKTTTAKAKNVLTKLKYDIKPNERLGPTMGVLQACRYFNFKWIALQHILTLQEETVQLHRIAGVSEKLRDEIILELPEYKKVADLEASSPQVTIGFWNFFLRHKSTIPATYAGACEVAIIMQSSATSERVFAMYAVLFGALDQRALEDMRETSVMLRMNRNWRINEAN
jgi:hypothetical protein